MDVRIRAIDESSYLNIISTIFKDLDLPQLMDRLVPMDPQCQTRTSDVVKLIILDILSGRQALVHLERWAHEIDLPKRIRPGLQPSWFNDDAIGRHLDRLYDANIHAVLSALSGSDLSERRHPPSGLPRRYDGQDRLRRL